MATPASIRNHPIHPMLVVFPIALWTTAMAFDTIGIMSGQGTLRAVAFYNIAAGIVGAVAAAIPGFIDYRTLRGRTARVGTWHALLNVTALAMFVVSWVLRTRGSAGFVGADSWIPVLLGYVGLAIVFASGWLGAALVYEHGVGVVPVTRAEPPRRRAA